MCGAVGLRGRWVRRQGTRCEGYCGAMLSAPWPARPPAPGNGHMHEEQATRVRVQASGLRYRTLTAWMSLSVRRPNTD
jgi:hypothetical protein